VKAGRKKGKEPPAHWERLLHVLMARFAICHPHAPQVPPRKEKGGGEKKTSPEERLPYNGADLLVAVWCMEIGQKQEKGGEGLSS